MQIPYDAPDYPHRRQPEHAPLVGSLATVLLAVPTQLPPAQKLPRVELLLVVAEIASTALIEPRTTRTLARTGIAVYKATRLKFDNGGQLVSFYGVGKTGKLTKVYINH